MNDLISRQDAIDAIEKLDIPEDMCVFEILSHIELAIGTLSPTQQWIPCSERLPEPGEYYLVTRQYIGCNCTEYREIDIAKYDFDGWHKADTVLAWCELPEPWKGETDEQIH